MSKVYAYVDETGDRGSGASSSPIFGMAAVIVAESHAHRLRSAVSQLRRDFKVPDTSVLSWKDHLKNHDRRRRAVEVLGAVTDVKVCFVYARKSALQPGSYVDDKQRFYNYVAFKMYKNVVWAARNAGASEINIRWGHVKHHDHAATKEYIEREAERAPTVPHKLVRSMRWVSADQYAESQAADLMGGFLKSATWPSGDFGYVEPSYLLDFWPSIRNADSCAIPLGIMSMPSYDVLTGETWFPCDHCKK